VEIKLAGAIQSWPDQTQSAPNIASTPLLQCGALPDVCSTEPVILIYGVCMGLILTNFMFYMKTDDTSAGVKVELQRSSQTLLVHL
jgi:hypothetical protein